MATRRAAGKPAISLPLSFSLNQSPGRIVDRINMGRPAVLIPEKIFFKIGEVCELAGVQAHVLRYWESEFPMLQPQKNRAGQRVYRKRDVEIALRIKELLYEDQYTIAGAKKRLANDLRTGGKLKIVSEENENSELEAGESETGETNASRAMRTAEERKSLRKVATELREILAMLDAPTKKG